MRLGFRALKFVIVSEIVYSVRMDKQTIIAKLRAHEQELRQAGLESLALFGSVARGDADADSDIDLAGVFARGTETSLLKMGGVATLIAEALDTYDFDLASEKKLHADVAKNFRKDSVRVF